MIVHGEMIHEPLWGRVIIKLSHLLLTISSASNIIIYSTKVCCKCIKWIINQTFNWRTSSFGQCWERCMKTLKCFSSIFSLLPLNNPHFKVFLWLMKIFFWWNVFIIIGSQSILLNTSIALAPLGGNMVQQENDGHSNSVSV